MVERWGVWMVDLWGLCLAMPLAAQLAAGKVAPRENVMAANSVELWAVWKAD